MREPLHQRGRRAPSTGPCGSLTTRGHDEPTKNRGVTCTHAKRFILRTTLSNTVKHVRLMCHGREKKLHAPSGRHMNLLETCFDVVFKHVAIQTSWQQLLQQGYEQFQHGDRANKVYKWKTHEHRASCTLTRKWSPDHGPRTAKYGAIRQWQKCGLGGRERRQSHICTSWHDVRKHKAMGGQHVCAQSCARK